MTLVNERSENHRPGNIEQPTKHQIHDHTPQESVPQILMNIILPRHARESHICLMTIYRFSFTGPVSEIERHTRVMIYLIP